MAMAAADLLNGRCFGYDLPQDIIHIRHGLLRLSPAERLCATSPPRAPPSVVLLVNLCVLGLSLGISEEGSWIASRLFSHCTTFSVNNSRFNSPHSGNLNLILKLALAN